MVYSISWEPPESWLLLSQRVLSAKLCSATGPTVQSQSLFYERKKQVPTTQVWTIIPPRLCWRCLKLFRTMRSRDHDVVLVRRTINPGCWEFGMGRGCEGGGQFTSNLGPRWTGSYHTKEGFQVSKREVGLKQQGKGSKRQGDCAIIMLSICIHVYNNCLNVECM